jgi:hypothetical protein
MKKLPFVSHSEMCRSQGNLQRAVSPWAVCGYLYVCMSRCIGMRFVIPLRKIRYWIQHVTRNTDVSHLERNIVTLFMGWISSSLRRFSTEVRRQRFPSPCQFLRTSVYTYNNLKGTLQFLLLLHTFIRFFLYDKGRYNEEPAGYSVPP